MKLPMREQAKMFLIENKYSVFPTGKNKVPLVPWIEFQHRFPTIAEIDAWWDRFPDAQIGIVTGELSNLTVVDVEKGGDPSFLPQDTTTVKTGGDGWHYYYTYAEGIKNSARIKDLVDIRSEGGYVVSPFSSSDKGSYDYIQQKDLLAFPRELFPQKQTNFSVPTAVSTLTKGAFCAKILNSYEGYGKGQRNAEMARFIGKVLVRVNPVHWDNTGWAIVMEANNKNSPPLSTTELATTFKSIKSARIRSTPVETPYGPDLSPQPLVIERDPEDKEKDAVKLMSKVAADQSISSDDIYPFEMPCFDDVIYGGACPGDLITVSGQTSHGKTQLALDWTVSFLRGKRNAHVLWFSYEVLVASLWKKFQTIGVKDDELVVIPAKHTSGGVAWVEEKIKEAKARYDTKIIVIDHLGFLLPRTTATGSMSLNYSTYLTQIVRDIKTIALQEEVIIILPVHMKKTDVIDMDAIKDSAGIGQESDLVFLLERERNKGKDAKSYFTDFTKITLAKNRKTGKTISAWFTMINERFAYDKRNNETEDEDQWGDFGKSGKEEKSHKADYKNPYDKFRK